MSGNHAAERMVEVWRGGLLESYHAGHAVICDDKGEVIEAWGDPGAVVFPRSSAKMLQVAQGIFDGVIQAVGR